MHTEKSLTKNHASVTDLTSVSRRITTFVIIYVLYNSSSD